MGSTVKNYSKEGQKLPLFGLILVFLLTACTPVSQTTKYDIEQAFSDSVFCQIMDGEIVPIEIRYGVGGEQGYLQYTSKEKSMIQKYIVAFRHLKLKEIVTDEDDFKYLTDAINDYIFCLEDRFS